jgi:hypothetical protein
MAAWHDRHDAAAEALSEVTALPAHALIEAYAVLTRLPAGLAVPAAAAAAALERRFPSRPLALHDRGELLRRLAAAGVFGGASYDGLVGLEADAHAETLLTLDARAQRTYQRLGVSFQAV